MDNDGNGLTDATGVNFDPGCLVGDNFGGGNQVTDPPAGVPGIGTGGGFYAFLKNGFTGGVANFAPAIFYSNWYVFNNLIYLY